MALVKIDAEGIILMVTPFRCEGVVYVGPDKNTPWEMSPTEARTLADALVTAAREIDGRPD